MMAAAWTLVVPLIARLAEEGPDPEDVKAGWLGFTVFLLLAAAIAFLGFSLRKHLRRVDFEEEPDVSPGTNGPGTNGPTPDGDHPTSA